MTGMKNIYLIKTFYPHWGKHTAFNAFLPYFDSRRFSITMVNVPMGRSPLLNRFLQALFAATGRKASGLPTGRATCWLKLLQP